MAAPRHEYQCWWNMIDRCHNSQSRGYKDYGAKGVAVCGRWRKSFWSFLADMGQRPSKLYSIDRVDCAGDYKPSNCRWATKKQQRANQRARNRLPDDEASKIWADKMLDEQEALDKINSVPGYAIEWTRSSAHRHFGPRGTPTGPRKARR